MAEAPGQEVYKPCKIDFFFLLPLLFFPLIPHGITPGEDENVELLAISTIITVHTLNNL